MAPLIAFVDSSVLLRVVLNQPDPLREWNSIDVGVVSALTHLEVTRTLDRLWQQKQLTEEVMLAKTAVAGEMMNRMITLELDQRVIDMASQSFPEPLATLDSLHLASALLFREAQPADQPPMVLATHDHQLATAARAMNFTVLGA